MVYQFELFVLAVAWLLAWRYAGTLRAGWCPVSAVIGRAARSPRTALFFIAAAAFLFSYWACWVAPLLPATHDGSSYLLAADTFSRFRLTNPPHPMWQHFETFHVLHQPTYQSKFPPAPGMMLAAGQLLFGTPMAGLGLGFALACAALYWMLQAWLPPKWAFLGAWLPLLRLGTADVSGLFGYWARSEASGAVTMLGGALLFGGLRRLGRGPRVHPSLALGLGAAILANSRPFSGMLVCLPVGAWLLWRLFRPIDGRRQWAARVLLPAGAVTALGLALVAYYNYRVTGDALLFPHVLHERTYYAAPHFVWLEPRPAPEHRHEVLRLALVEYQLANYYRYRDNLNLRIASLIGVIRPMAGPLLYIPLALFPFFLRRRWLVLAGCCFVLPALGYLQIPTPSNPHYLAAAAPLLYLFAVEGLRRIARFRAGRQRWGEAFVALLFAGMLASRLFSIAVFLREPAGPSVLQQRERQRIINTLQAEPGRDLVIVRLPPAELPDGVWVTNEADIDSAEIVWAREMDEAANRRLIDSYRGRRAWLLRVDETPVLERYPPL